MAKDAICGMTVNETTALHVERDGQTFYFCSEHCRQEFIGRTAPRNPPIPAAMDPEQKCCGGGHGHPQTEHGGPAHHDHDAHEDGAVKPSVTAKYFCL